MMVSKYIDSNRTPPLGMAVLLLGGALQNLEEAVERNDLTAILNHLQRGYKIEDIYCRSLEEATSDSTLTFEYGRVGSACLAKLHTIRDIGQRLLSSSVKLSLHISSKEA